MSQCTQRFLRFIDNGLFMCIEAGVHKTWDPGEIAEFSQDIIIKRIVATFDNLWTSRSIHMNNCLNFICKVFSCIDRDSHVTARQTL